MSIPMEKRIVAAAVALAFSLASIAAQQPLGVLAGKATDEARTPYTDYAVQVRDATTGHVVQTVVLGLDGKFTFGKLLLTQPYLVELFHQKERRVICTEGPYTLTASLPSKTDINITCGKVPAAFWILLAGAGAAATVAVATRSVSK
jgi:hypothetical protein